MSAMILLRCDGPHRHPTGCGARFPVENAATVEQAREVAARVEGWVSAGHWDGCRGHAETIEQPT